MPGVLPATEPAYASRGRADSNQPLMVSEESSSNRVEIVLNCAKAALEQGRAVSLLRSAKRGVRRRAGDAILPRVMQSCVSAARRRSPSSAGHVLRRVRVSPRPVPASPDLQGTERLRRARLRSTARRRRGSVEADRAFGRAVRRGGILQSRHPGQGFAHSSRRRLCAEERHADRPVPVVFACRGRGSARKTQAPTLGLGAERHEEAWGLDQALSPLLRDGSRPFEPDHPPPRQGSACSRGGLRLSQACNRHFG